MKKILIISGIIAAFLCLAQNANAQIAGPIHRDGAYLADQRGNILSNQEVLTLVGQRSSARPVRPSSGAVSAASSAAVSSTVPVLPRLPTRSPRTAARKKSRKPWRPIPVLPA